MVEGMIWDTATGFVAGCMVGAMVVICVAGKWWRPPSRRDARVGERCRYTNKGADKVWYRCRGTLHEICNLDKGFPGVTCDSCGRNDEDVVSPGLRLETKP